MGRYGSCKDCIHCGEIYKCDGRDEYRCSVSGNYFDSMYGGDKCRHYVNAEEEYARQKRKNTENTIAKAIYLNMIIDSLFSSDSDYDEDEEKPKRNENSSLDKFWGCLMGCCMIFGILVAIFSNSHRNYSDDFKKALNQSIYESKWSIDANGVPYLISFVKPPGFLSEETVRRDAYWVVSGHNNLIHKFKARNNLDEVKRATRLHAYLVKDFQGVNALKETGIYLLSANASSDIAKKVRDKGHLLVDNGTIASSVKKAEIESKRIPESKIVPEKPNKWEKANIAKYTLSSYTGADKLIEIGKKVVISDRKYVECYDKNFEWHKDRDFSKLSVQERIVTVLDTRIAKYNGGGTLSEKLRLQKGVVVGKKVVYEIRKGNRLRIKDKKGNKYLCEIPLRGGATVNVYLEEWQFNVKSKRNWYFINVPGTNTNKWISGKNLRELVL